MVRKRDWVKTAADERAWDEGCRPDPDAAEHVREFFTKYLRHSKGEFAGKPFELLPWQWKHVIRPLFAWKRPDKTRRFRVGYLSVAKKNGKSTLLSGIGLYLLMADDEAGSEVYSAAADRDQAAIIFNECASMVDYSAALSSRLEVNRTNKRITYAAKRSWYRALSAEAGTKAGLNIHGLLFDELYVQKTPDLWNELRYGGAMRRQPLLLSITTAGYNRETICYRQYEYAKRILDGTLDDPTYFAYICEASPDDDWSNPKTWKKANPSYGVTVKEDAFEADFEEAQERPDRENAFRQLRLNQWVQQSVRLIPMDKWDRCDGPVSEAALAGRGCHGGLDLASTTDVAALSLLFPDGDGRYAVLPYFWVPEEGARVRERRDGVPYGQWARQGIVEMTPGNSIDYDRIRARINDLGERFNIRDIAIDRWNSTQLQQQLMGDGFDVQQFGQGYRDMTAPTKELLSIVLDERLSHGGNPCLRWMADNLAGETDAADNWKPSKKKSTEKIDGIVALIMALGRAMLATDDTSVYEEAGTLAL